VRAGSTGVGVTSGTKGRRAGESRWERAVGVGAVVGLAIGLVGGV
jgi:hypothetical protein